MQSKQSLEGGEGLGEGKDESGWYTKRHVLQHGGGSHENRCVGSVEDDGAVGQEAERSHDTKLSQRDGQRVGVAVIKPLVKNPVLGVEEGTEVEASSHACL